MDNKFKNPVKGSERKEKKDTPWDYKQPCYDERSSWFLNAGTDYGVGHVNPVGHTGEPKQRVATLPYGKGHGMDFEKPSDFRKTEVEE